MQGRKKEMRDVFMYEPVNRAVSANITNIRFTCSSIKNLGQLLAILFIYQNVATQRLEKIKLNSSYPEIKNILA